MREISEDEAFGLVGASECPVLRKEVSAPMEAAVCLKRFPSGYVPGVSDKVRDLRLWFTEDLAEAVERYQAFVRVMRVSGPPIR